MFWRSYFDDSFIFIDVHILWETSWITLILFDLPWNFGIENEGNNSLPSLGIIVKRIIQNNIFYFRVEFFSKVLLLAYIWILNSTSPFFMWLHFFCNLTNIAHSYCIKVRFLEAKIKVNTNDMKNKDYLVRFIKGILNAFPAGSIVTNNSITSISLFFISNIKTSKFVSILQKDCFKYG